MDHFTPIAAIAGGLAIGIATLVYFMTLGAYAGVSGIARSAFFPGDPERLVDALFLLGIVLGGALWFVSDVHARSLPPGPPLAFVVAGGLLVGFGTSLGHGCTSGHGVCGLGRLSRRSLAAVATFMATAFATVFAVRHVF